MSNKGVSLSFSPESIKSLVEQGFNPEFGARPIKRAIQNKIINPLSLALLNEEFVLGDSIKVLINKKRKGEFFFEK